MSRVFFFGAVSMLSCATALGDAGNFDPLPAFNQSPLVQIFGLPALAPARVLARGRTEIGLHLEAANNFFIDANASEALTLDGETHRTTLSVHYGSGNAEWGIEVPYVSHGAGFMDSFIENWHDTLGLPSGGRETVPRNQFTYRYQRNGADLLRLTNSTSGVGDVRLLGAWPISADGGPIDIVLRASLKLPTGDASALHGSGAADVAIWLTAGCTAAACPDSLRWNASGGLLVLGRGDVLPDLQRRVVAFGGAGVGWQVWETIVLKLQLLAHTPFYQGSELTPLAASAVQLVLGGTWSITDSTLLDIGISEDLRLHTAPDVSLLLNLRSRF